MNNAFEYSLKVGGLQREEDYPYTGRDGTCKFEKSKIAASVSNFSVVSIDEDQVAANLVKNGPLAGNPGNPFHFSPLSYNISNASRTWKHANWVFLLGFCSGNQCSLHADLRRGSFMPIHMCKAS